MIRNILLALIVAINLYFIIYFLRDLFKNKQNFKEEPGDMRLLPFTSFITFFLSTFGVSDFAIGTVLYPKLKWVSMKKLPGTLNTQCVVPVAVMALSYITAINVGIKTLAVCIICQIIGAYLGPRIVWRKINLGRIFTLCLWRIEQYRHWFLCVNNGNCLLARLESSCSLSYYDGGLYILSTDRQCSIH